MCGVVCYWAREGLLSRHQYDLLFTGAEQRGMDGFGVTIKGETIRSLKVLGPYSSERNNVLDFVEQFMGVGDILIASCRATPETEKETDMEMIQPMEAGNPIDLVLSHNGGVTDSVKDSLAFDYQTNIDSEAIIAAYLQFGKNMKNAMEFLSGSFAFVMLDTISNQLYAVTSFNPLAHMYIRGCGYFYHSDNDVLTQVLESITGAKRDGMNVWESWYHHYLPGYTIIQTDLDSGSQSHTEYDPRFLHPVWNSTEKEYAQKTYVIASGGIDSGLTTHLLKLVGRDVTMIHFHYGQKAERAEAWATRALSAKFDVPYLYFDLSDLYHKLADRSMLLRDEIPIRSGGEFLKSTIAWVAGRNAIFASIVLAFAETSIFNWNYSHVDIAAGWAQLSEETGGYPDNSFYFQQALNMLKDFGYITGKRIHFLPVLQRITKTECWSLGAALKFPFELTVSCDNPKMIGGGPWLCPDCGSTKMSIIAADRANVKDERRFTKERPKLSKPTSVASHRTIIDRLILTQAEKEKLREMI